MNLKWYPLKYHNILLISFLISSCTYNGSPTQPESNNSTSQIKLIIDQENHTQYMYEDITFKHFLNNHSTSSIPVPRHWNRVSFHTNSDAIITIENCDYLDLLEINLYYSFDLHGYPTNYNVFTICEPSESNSCTNKMSIPEEPLTQIHTSQSINGALTGICINENSDIPISFIAFFRKY